MGLTQISNRNRSHNHTQTPFTQMGVRTITLSQKHDHESSRCHNKQPNTLRPDTNSLVSLMHPQQHYLSTLGQHLHLRDLTLQTLLLPSPGPPGFLTFSILSKGSGPNSDSHSRRGRAPRPAYSTDEVNASQTSAVDHSADVPTGSSFGSQCLLGNVVRKEKGPS